METTLPRLDSSETPVLLPFVLKMRQFSVTSAFTVTLKQGQTFYMLGFILKMYIFYFMDINMLPYDMPAIVIIKIMCSSETS
jgi:hypothetical protein